MEGIRTEVKRVKALDPADADAPPMLGMPISYLLDLKTYDPVHAAKDFDDSNPGASGGAGLRSQHEGLQSVEDGPRIA